MIRANLILGLLFGSIGSLYAPPGGPPYRMVYFKKEGAMERKLQAGETIGKMDCDLILTEKDSRAIQELSNTPKNDAAFFGLVSKLIREKAQLCTLVTE